MKAAVVALALTTSLFAQEQPIPSKVMTEGPCSPNVLLNEDKVVITCHGVVDPELREQIDKTVVILNEIYKLQGSDSKAMNVKLDEILQSLRNFERSVQPRRLTEQQKAFLKRELSKASRVSVKVNCILGREGMQYAEDLVAVFKNAGWDDVDGVSQNVYTKTFVGVQFTVSDKFQDPSLLPRKIRTLALVEILLKAGVLQERTIFQSTGVDADTVQIRVGLRE